MRRKLVQSMQEITVSEFKARCLALLADLGPEGLIITKHGEPVAKVVPINPRPNLSELIGCMEGEIKIVGDIQSTGRKWNAAQ